MLQHNAFQKKYLSKKKSKNKIKDTYSINSFIWNLKSYTLIHFDKADPLFPADWL